MGILAEIKQKLLAGKRPAELIKEGYPKSSVYYVAKKIRNVQSGIPGLPLDDELTELRRKRESVKLEKEIAELEAAKENLPNRVGTLESRLSALEYRTASSRSVLRNAVDTALFHAFIYGHSLMISNLENFHKVEADATDIERGERELREYCNGWVEKQIERLET